MLTGLRERSLSEPQGEGVLGKAVQEPPAQGLQTSCKVLELADSFISSTRKKQQMSVQTERRCHPRERKSC